MDDTQAMTVDNAAQRISDMLMLCAERLGNFPRASANVDPYAWQALLTYAPKDESMDDTQRQAVLVGLTVADVMRIICANVDQQAIEAALIANLPPYHPAAAPQSSPEPLTWEFTGLAGFTRFVTDSRYQGFSPAVQKWYRPVCQKCALPEGWKLVPLEPTEAMLDAACDIDARGEAESANLRKYPSLMPFSTAGEVFAIQYRAALAASPQEPTKQG